MVATPSNPWDAHMFNGHALTGLLSITPVRGANSLKTPTQIMFLFGAYASAEQNINITTPIDSIQQPSELRVPQGNEDPGAATKTQQLIKDLVGGNPGEMCVGVLL